MRTERKKERCCNGYAHHLASPATSVYAAAYMQHEATSTPFVFILQDFSNSRRRFFWLKRFDGHRAMSFKKT
ncbi:hypothetical protein AMEX_G2134 [Astyanax mexicanus]|uniref:Uncharacterized protein n=1 Tax=Astyanax mexicanus TaxID=7994 RepID=A0A8T2MMZ2_ASTMX|nr:hypothetical protein AMEX_G2134 [Astyanax mexicanus]